MGTTDNRTRRSFNKQRVCLLLAVLVWSRCDALTKGPTEDSLWYYEIGGAQPVSVPANPSVVPVTLGGSAQLGLGYSCGKFDPVAAGDRQIRRLRQWVDPSGRGRTGPAYRCGGGGHDPFFSDQNHRAADAAPACKRRAYRTQVGPRSRCRRSRDPPTRRGKPPGRRRGWSARRTRSRAHRRPSPRRRPEPCCPGRPDSGLGGRRAAGTARP